MKNIDCFPYGIAISKLLLKRPTDIPEGGGATIALAGFGLNHLLSSI